MALQTQAPTLPQRFDEYKAMVKRAIESCTNNVQLMVAFDFKDLFYERFAFAVDNKLLAEATIELEQCYLDKHTALHI
jgi:hypothetical protein